MKSLLEDESVFGFLGQKMIGGYPLPYLFTKDSLNDLEEAAMSDAHYPMTTILQQIVRQHPDKTFAVMVRGCDERALKELYKWNQLDQSRIITIGVACSQELAEECECRLPFPSMLDYGEKAEPVAKSTRLEKVKVLADDERLRYWLENFNRCIKCFGCRDVCPMCFCNECALEHAKLIHGDQLPPDNPTFHLVRAVHMAGRCIDCGLCEAVCPAHIPLRILYKQVAEIVNELFGYRPGLDEDYSPFSLLGEEVRLETKPL